MATLTITTGFHGLAMRHPTRLDIFLCLGFFLTLALSCSCHSKSPSPSSAPSGPALKKDDVDGVDGVAPLDRVDHSRLSDSMQDAIRLHLEGVNGDDEAAEKALTMLVELKEQSPEERPLGMAYLGSAKLLAAKRVLLPWKKNTLCKEGLALLDNAVTMAPRNPEIRFLRAISAYPLPGFFGRKEDAVKDFAWLNARWKQALDGGSLSVTMVGEVLYYHGLCREEASDLPGARASWRLAAEAAPDTKAARNARKKLAEAPN